MGGGCCDVGGGYGVVVVLVVLVVVLTIVTEVAVVIVVLSLSKNAIVWLVAVGVITSHVMVAAPKGRVPLKKHNFIHKKGTRVLPPLPLSDPYPLWQH